MISKAKQQNMAESEAKSGLSKQAEYVKSAGKFEYRYSNISIDSKVALEAFQ